MRPRIAIFAVCWLALAAPASTQTFAPPFGGPLRALRAFAGIPDAYNALDCGAVPDRVSDTAAALQACLNKANGNGTVTGGSFGVGGGAAVYLPDARDGCTGAGAPYACCSAVHEGTCAYAIASGLTLTGSNVYVGGAGGGSRIVPAASNFVALTITGNANVVQAIAIEGTNTTNAAGDLLVITGDGIGGNSQGQYDQVLGVELLRGSGSGLVINGGFGTIVQFNKIHDNRGRGIETRCNSNRCAFGSLIEGNDVVGNLQGNVTPAGCVDIAGQNNVVKGNNITLCGSGSCDGQGGGTQCDNQWGVRIHGEGNAGNDLCSNNTIEGNQIHLAQAGGVTIDTTSSTPGCKMNSIIDNEIVGSGTGSGTHVCNVASQVADCGAGGACSGTPGLCTAGATQFKLPGVGILLNNPASTLSNWGIATNVIDGSRVDNVKTSSVGFGSFVGNVNVNAGAFGFNNTTATASPIAYTGNASANNTSGNLNDMKANMLSSFVVIGHSVADGTPVTTNTTADLLSLATADIPPLGRVYDLNSWGTMRLNSVTNGTGDLFTFFVTVAGTTVCTFPALGGNATDDFPAWTLNVLHPYHLVGTITVRDATHTEATCNLVICALPAQNLQCVVRGDHENQNVNVAAAPTIKVRLTAAATGANTQVRDTNTVLSSLGQ